MKRIFFHPVAALLAGLSLRLFFVLKFPANSGDTVLYEQIATNWLKHHVYGMDVQGALTPVDLRMPGYPAFLVLIYAVTGHTGEAARLWVMFAQIGVDLLSCWAIACLCSLLAASASQVNAKRVFTAGIWLAALCPFTANYAAVPLTEVFVVLLTAIALILFVAQFRRLRQTDFVPAGCNLVVRHRPVLLGTLGGLFVGLATLFRPESPLLLVPIWVTLGWVCYRRTELRFWLRSVILSSVACVIPLVPWAVRNAITLHEAQLLTPKYSNLPGELVPYGFMAWEKTWLYRVRDCYLVAWKLNDESIDVDQIPSRAFDSPGEKERVGDILDQYNEDLTLTQEEDAVFGQIARERTRRHPPRTFLLIPAARAVAIWFTPRIELLPIAGNVFPLAYMREEDPADQQYTILLFLLNILYMGLGVWGGLRLCRLSEAARPLVAMLILFFLLRTAFLTTLETPEPRYVLVCFPPVIALGAQVFARRFERQSAS